MKTLGVWENKKHDIHPGRLTWNLEMMVSKFGISFSKGPFSGSMFVLGGVILDCLLNLGKTYVQVLFDMYGGCCCYDDFMALSVHFSYSSVENPTVCENSWNFRP